MGNFIKFSAAYLVLGSSFDSISRTVLKDHEIESDILDTIEIRSSPLYFLPIGSHSYAIAKTFTGRNVRFDYTSNKKAEFTYDYFEFYISELLRSGKVIPSTSVKTAIRVFKKHSEKAEYSVLSHDCHTVTNDFYDEITGNDEVNLAREFAEILKAEYKKGVKITGYFTDILFEDNHRYYCKIIRKALKRGKTKHDIRKTFREIEKSASSDRVGDLYKMMFDGKDEDIEQLKKTITVLEYKELEKIIEVEPRYYVIKQPEFVEMYTEYLENENKINKIWVKDK